MLTTSEIIDCLKELKIESPNIQNLELKKISIAFKKLALILHPDKAGKESKIKFQQLRAAYEKLCDHLIHENNIVGSKPEGNFFEDNFSSFNFPHENQGSFTVRIEDSLASIWNDCISQSLGLPLIKSNSKGTEIDRLWKVLHNHHGIDVELTVHIYIKPKNHFMTNFESNITCIIFSSLKI